MNLSMMNKRPMNTPPPIHPPGFSGMRTLRSLLLLAGMIALAASAAAAAAAPAPVPAPAPPTAAAAAPVAAAPTTSASNTDAGGTRALDQQIQDLKKDVIDLNRDLFVLEEELLFPANTQVAVFVSMDVV